MTSTPSGTVARSRDRVPSLEKQKLAGVLMEMKRRQWMEFGMFYSLAINTRRYQEISLGDRERNDMRDKAARAINRMNSGLGKEREGPEQFYVLNSSRMVHLVELLVFWSDHGNNWRAMFLPANRGSIVAGSSL